jgi:hypothetical protein
MTLFSALFQYNLAVGLYLVALQDKHNIHILSAKTIFIALTAKQPFSPVSIPHTNKSDIFHKLKKINCFFDLNTTWFD